MGKKVDYFESIMLLVLVFFLQCLVIFYFLTFFGKCGSTIREQIFPKHTERNGTQVIAETPEAEREQRSRGEGEKKETCATFPIYLPFTHRLLTERPLPLCNSYGAYFSAITSVPFHTERFLLICTVYSPSASQHLLHLKNRYAIVLNRISNLKGTEGASNNVLIRKTSQIKGWGSRIECHDDGYTKVAVKVEPVIKLPRG